MNVRERFDAYWRHDNYRSYIEHELPLQGAGAIAETLIVRALSLRLKV